MKKFILFALSVVTITACNKNHSTLSTFEDGSRFEQPYCSESVFNSELSNLPDYERYGNYDEPEAIEWEDTEVSIINTSRYNHYYANSDGYGSVTITDLDGNYYYVNVDEYGNLSAYDLNGNYYHSSTDDYGNTSGYDSNGNFYYSSTDGCGNTTGYDSNGNFYYSSTDDFGNTTGYDTNGNFYSSYTDDFGNTTINIY